MATEPVRSPLRATVESTQPGVLDSILQAAEATGIDPLPELYNEALIAAQEGRLKEARDRLRIMLALAPRDGGAQLLLAKVLVSLESWYEAIAALDEAEILGAPIPHGLRMAIEGHLPDTAHTEPGDATRAREQGELRALREEAARLRELNQLANQQVNELEREASRWAWISAAVCVIGAGFLLRGMFAPADVAPAVAVAPVVEEDIAVQVDPEPVAAATPAATEPPATPAAPPAAAPTPAAAAPTPEPAAAPADPPVAAASSTPMSGTAKDVYHAISRLPGVQANQVSVEMVGGVAELSGELPDAKVRREAVKIAKGTSGVKDVNWDQIQLTVSRVGGIHVVQSGESLSIIAFKVYGDTAVVPQILAANPQLGADGSKLKLGQELKLPALR